MLEIIDDFKEFAPSFLKVKSKAGQIVPFRMNVAQEYIHSKLEEQLNKTGMVRAIILKGRQQGCCFAPHMRVLTADYRWIPIGSVKVGDALVACDENTFGETKAGRKHSRKFRTAIVEHTETFEKQLYEVVFDNGAVLEVTNDHRMLCKKRGGTDAQWREVGELIIGDSVRVATRPPTYEQTTYEDGWISGVIDGEGSSRTGNGAKRLSIHQRNTPILGRIKSYFDSIQMPYKEVIDARIGGINKLGRDPVHRIDIHRLPYLIEIFSRCRPTRFTNDRWHEGHELPGKAAIDGIKPWAKVVSIRPLSVSKVIDLQTSTKTYICEGLVSHNSTYIEARFFHKTITNFGKKTFILTHEQAATANLFEMTDRYYQNLPERLKPELSASNAKELSFRKLDSSFVVATAGNKGAGRSATAHLFHGCLGAGTKIIDGNTMGLKDISDAVVGDSVITHNGNIGAVSYVSSQEKECFDVKVNGVNGYELISSGEHRFFTRDGWKELKDLSVGDEVGYPIRAINHSIKELPFAAQVCLRAHGGGCVENVPQEVELNFDLGRLVGLYLAEGFVKYQAKYPDNPSAVQFAVHENEVDRTVEWLSACGKLFKSVTVLRRNNSKTCTVSANGKSIGIFIANLVGRCDKKMLPYGWWNMGEDFVRGMVIGYFAGDGHGDQQSLRVSATSIRASLSIGMREVLASLGYGWATISRKPAAIRHGRNEREAHILRLSGVGAKVLSDEIGKPCNPASRVYKQKYFKLENGYCWTRIKSIDPIGIRQVFDLEVNHDDHSYCLIHAATHNSEAAYWPSAEDHQAGIMQTIPMEPGTEIVLESTANGIGNMFHRVWQQGESNDGGWIAIFVPWFWQQEYRYEGVELGDEDYNYGKIFGLDKQQMQWRRYKIGELGGDVKLFMREYPSSSAEAFSVSSDKSLIDSFKVQVARKAVATPDSSAPKIIGVDPARFGNDSTSMFIRQGRISERIKKVKGKDTMEVVGEVISAMNTYKPDAVFVDQGGIGAGIYDRLKELGYVNVFAVNFGGDALDKKKYYNKRSEMWCLMRDWIASQPAQIPDDDVLETDLCGLHYSYDSDGRTKLESKDDAKKRGIKSPDDGDALALTFAMPVKRKEFNKGSFGSFKPSVTGFGG